MATATITIPWTVSGGTSSYTINLYQCTSSACSSFTNSNQPIQTRTITNSQNGSFSETFTVTGLSNAIHYFKAAFVGICPDNGGAETNIVSVNCQSSTSESSTTEPTLVYGYMNIDVVSEIQGAHANYDANITVNGVTCSSFGTNYAGGGGTATTCYILGNCGRSVANPAGATAAERGFTFLRFGINFAKLRQDNPTQNVFDVYVSAGRYDTSSVVRSNNCVDSNSSNSALIVGNFLANNSNIITQACENGVTFRHNGTNQLAAAYGCVGPVLGPSYSPSNWFPLALGSIDTVAILSVNVITGSVTYTKL